MTDTVLSSETILAIQRDITNEYPDTTVAGNSSHKPGFVDYLLTHTDNWQGRASRVLFNITVTHPFPDGNKRTAINSSAVACIEAGYIIEADKMRDIVLHVARNEWEDVDVVKDEIVACATKFDSSTSNDMACEIAKSYRNEYRKTFDKLSTE